MNLYDPKTAPSVFDIVWCKWPRREDKLGPGPWVRPVLVLDVRPMIHVPTKKEYAAVTAAYGTGSENVDARDLAEHLFIPLHRAEQFGLNKGTVFKLDIGNRKQLPWAEEYFVPQGYVQAQGIIAGALEDMQKEKVLGYFKKHGFQFPLP